VCGRDRDTLEHAWPGGGEGEGQMGRSRVSPTDEPSPVLASLIANRHRRKKLNRTSGDRFNRRL